MSEVLFDLPLWYNHVMHNTDEISRLGFGCMRLPKDYEKSEKLVLRAMEQGINYFDTAYIYPGNEELIGRILDENNCRDKVKIATKIPQYFIKKPEDLDRYFETSLKRLRTDYVDYYLMHMLADVKAWERLKTFGIEEWIEEKIKSGRIKHIGFSYHGGSENHMKLVDAYPWEFTMVQYNYMDENSQAGKEGVRYARDKGLKVFIMEPLRGGLLANKLPEQAKEMIANEKHNRSAAEWALKWLWNQSEVDMVLSGMQEMDVIDENIRVERETPSQSITDEEKQFYDELRLCIQNNMKVGCTGCAYCMPCPYGVNIPMCFHGYNSSFSEGRYSGIKEYFMVTAMARKASYASLCKACGKCTEHCPQDIPIPKLMPKVKRRLEIPGFGIARW